MPDALQHVIDRHVGRGDEQHLPVRTNRLTDDFGDDARLASAGRPLNEADVQRGQRLADGFGLPLRKLAVDEAEWDRLPGDRLGPATLRLAEQIAELQEVGPAAGVSQLPQGIELLLELGDVTRIHQVARRRRRVALEPLGDAERLMLVAPPNTFEEEPGHAVAARVVQRVLVDVRTLDGAEYFGRPLDAQLESASGTALQSVGILAGELPEPNKSFKHLAAFAGTAREGVVTSVGGDLKHQPLKSGRIDVWGFARVRADHLPGRPHMGHEFLQCLAGGGSDGFFKSGRELLDIHRFRKSLLLGCGHLDLRLGRPAMGVRRAEERGMEIRPSPVVVPT